VLDQYDLSPSPAKSNFQVVWAGGQAWLCCEDGQTWLEAATTNGPRSIALEEFKEGIAITLVVLISAFVTKVCIKMCLMRIY
jgi:hypothetical protein